MSMLRSWCGLAGAVLLAGCGGSVKHFDETGIGGGAGSTSVSSSVSTTSGTGGTRSAGSGGTDPFGTGATTSSGIGGAAISATGGAGGATIGTGGGNPGPATEPCVTAGTSQERWLTNPEYDNTVRDLLGGPATPSITAQFPEDTLIDFRVETEDPTGMVPIGHRYEHLALGRDNILKDLRPRLRDILPCDPVATGEQACAQKFIATFGLRAYRRPLTMSDVTDLSTAYEHGRMAADFNEGILQVVGAALLARPFLRIESAGPRGVFAPLNPYALASRLSYFLYRSMPDQPLFDAAASGKLSTLDEVTAQTKRMLADPKAHQAVTEFFQEWLSLDKLTGSPWAPNEKVTKDPTVAPDFDSLRAYMRTETTMFAEDIFFTGASLSELYKRPASWINEPLAKLYGVDGVTGLAFRQVSFVTQRRSGLFTQASILSVPSSTSEPSPTNRGVYVNDKLLCRPVPPPPPNVLPLLPLQPGETNRERYQKTMATGGPACASCHAIIDPIGYGYESYDIEGRYRTADNGLPIDASGTVTVNGGANTYKFTDGAELSAILGVSFESDDCMATKWFRFALSRPEEDADSCSLGTIQRAFRNSRTLPDLVLTITQSSAFRYARW
jgi:hypothetical protein